MSDCRYPGCTTRPTIDVADDEAWCRKHAHWEADRSQRIYVMERDGRECQRCHAPAHDRAHLLPRGNRYVKYEPENAVALCRPCHVIVDGSPALRTAWVMDRWPGRLERLWNLEAAGERRGDSVDLAAILRGYRETALTPAEMAAYRSGKWLG